MIIGHTIQQYEILAKLGEGGMGVVYKARDTRLDRIVALKFLPSQRDVSEDDKARFIQEARAASALSHPNVCTIHDIKEFDDQLFIVMEYVEGRTLRDATQEHSVMQTVEIVAQVADGLAAAHEKGIVHRDIKADNIMVRADGRAQIMDFGLAKLPGVSLLTKVGSTVGTISYMSPEQAQGGESDHRTDIFSLGVLFYELLAGRLPFHGAHDAAVMYEVINADPPPPSSLNNRISTELDRVVLKCLEKKPEERYQAVKEVAVDLRRFMRGSESHRNTVRVEEPRRTTQSLRIGIPAAVAALLGVIALFVLHPSGDELSSLAVLPFENVSHNEDMEYLSDGISESLINALSQLPQLKVMSRSSVFRFKGNLADPQAIGKTLGVRAVLLGRVLQRGGSLIINAELIDVADNTHLWGGQYNRQSADILVVQEDIAREISQNLRLRLGDSDKERLTHRSTESTEAYEYYLKGRYQWNKRSADGLRRSIEYFQRAVEKDSTYALAYSGMADTYSVLGWFEYGLVPPASMLEKGRVAAQKAVAIDPQRSEGYCSLAFADWSNYHWSSPEGAFRQAFELNPSYATAHQWYAEFVCGMGDTARAVKEMELALTLDPLSLIITRDVGWMLYFARRYSEADGFFRRALEFDPNFMRGHLILGQSLLQQKRFDEALKELETASRLSEGTTATCILGCGYAMAGRRSDADAILAELLSPSQERYVSPAGISLIFASLGNRDRAFEWLEKALDEKSGMALFIKVEPLFDPLRGDRRFAALVKRIGLE